MGLCARRQAVRRSCSASRGVLLFARSHCPHPKSHLRDYAGILQADAYAGFNRLYEADRKPGPITEASCWAHGRRKFFELADVTAKARGKLAVIAPLAFEAVKRIDAIFDIERTNNAAERALRRIALGRKSWLFAYSSSPWRHRCGARACHIPRAARCHSRKFNPAGFSW